MSDGRKGDIMPLVFIALVVAMLIASYIDNKKQEKRFISQNEQS